MNPDNCSLGDLIADLNNNGGHRWYLNSTPKGEVLYDHWAL